MKTFGETLKDIRIKSGLTLRDCAHRINFDASNWSKVERGINPAPKEETLREWAVFFHLPEAETQALIDLGAMSQGKIPKDMASNEAVLEALPVFFRAARGAAMDEDKFKQFIEQVRKIHSPD
jgi:transcriptional regulator with XRE-family HTH domain